MSLTVLIQDKVSKAFDTSLADAVNSFILQKKVSTFNSALNTVTDIVTEYTSRGVFARYKITNLNDTHIMPNDVKLIILQNELAITPEVDDIVIQQDKKYLVKHVKQDPIAATWTLQCRQ